MKKISLIVILASLWACEAPKPNVEEQIFQGEAQGTTYTVKYLGEVIESLPAKMDSLLLEIDNSMSTWVKDSKISQLNNGDSIEMDAMFIDVFKLSQAVYQKTDGAFDPGIGPLIQAWGFDFSDPMALDSALVDSLRAFSNIQQFQLLENGMMVKNDPRAKINFNAVAQGYSVDLMADLLTSRGIDNYYVELGGEVICKGKNKNDAWWQIGIDKPVGENLERELSAIVSLENQAMVTSGNYRKYIEMEGERYSHALNPSTGFPVKHNLLSATIFAPTGGEADAMATACMVMGLEKAKKLINEQAHLEAIFIYDLEGELRTYATEGISAKVKELD